MSFAIFALGVRAKALALALRSLWPHEITDAQALTHATAAVDAETHQVSAELLLAIAYGESRFDSRWLATKAATQRLRVGAFIRRSV